MVLWEEIPTSVIVQKKVAIGGLTEINYDVSIQLVNLGYMEFGDENEYNEILKIYYELLIMIIKLMNIK